MPRVGRVVLPNYPHHVVQRGHNRQVVFAAEEDYLRCVKDLRELKDAFGITWKRGRIYFLQPKNLTDREARAWYLSKEAEIPARINSGASLEEQAKQAFDMRNDVRSTARELMSNRTLADSLNKGKRGQIYFPPIC